MRIDRLGEGAAILRDLDADPALVAMALEDAHLPGLIEAIASYETVGIYFEDGFDLRLIDGIHGKYRSDGKPRTHQIPTCYELGEDTGEVAHTLGLTLSEVIAEHTSHEYRCYAVGFCPGFPYLGYLPEKLQAIARKKEPRRRVEPGSVAITGRQTGVYPLPRPGGWSIIGRTPLVLVDVEERYFPIRAGDRVQFVAIGRDEYQARVGERL